MIQQRTANTSGKGNTKEYIILHHTASSYESIEGVLNWFKNTQANVSAHYVIDTNGDVYNFNSNDDILRHAGTSEWEGKTNLNLYSIGIEIIGPLPGFTFQQRKSCDFLIRNLMELYNITPEKIIRHRDVAPQRKTDIHDDFWKNSYNSREEYQQSFTSQIKMTEKEKEMLILNQMNINSIMYNNVDDQKLKEIMSEMNKRYRELGFDNK